MDDVTSWLGANHFTIDRANLATRTVRFSGTVTQVERAFSTGIVTSAQGYANVTDPQIPRRLAGTITAIFGLSRQPAEHIGLAELESADAPAASSIASSHFTPKDFWTYYDESSPITASNNGGTGASDCIAFLENDSIQAAEFEAFDTQFDLPPVDLTVVLTPSSKISFETKHPRSRAGCGVGARCRSRHSDHALRKQRSGITAAPVRCVKSRGRPERMWRNQFQYPRRRESLRRFCPDFRLCQDRISGRGSGSNVLSRFRRFRLVFRLRPAR
jgi:hypothetical protein